MSHDQKLLAGTSTAAAATALGGPSTSRAGGASRVGISLRSKDDSKSLLVLEIVLYINWYYTGLFWLFQILMFIYKGESLPYTFGILAGEVILVFAISLVDLARIALCSFGNLAGNRVATALGIILTGLLILGIIYLLFFQTYTLRAELITCSVALVFYLLGIILSIGALISMT